MSKPPVTRPHLFVFLVAGVWLGLVVAESWHRLDPFIHPPGRRPSGTPTPYLRSVRRTLKGDFGGDLTRMLGFAARARLFGVPRGDIEVVTDRRGYRNEPRLADTYCPVVVAGDSFMDQGLTNADTPAGQLSRLLGVPVYDHTCMAQGPAYSVHVFLGDAGFRRKPPRVLVWGFIERNMDGRRFPPWPPKAKRRRAPRSLRGRLEALAQSVNEARAELGKWLRRWSLLKRWAIAVRAEATWRLASQLITEKAIVGHSPTGPVLFLRGGVQRLARTARQRRLGSLVAAVRSVDAECRRRGIHLVVLLIPDKAHIYPRWLPPEERPETPVPNALDDLEARLSRKGIHVVNLLPVFAARSGADQPLLYYPDDTHWSEHGIRVAMEAVAADLRRRGIPLLRRLLPHRHARPVRSVRRPF